MDGFPVERISKSGLKLSFVDYATCRLVFFPGLKGSCLVEIARSCNQLRRLSIGFLGSALKDSNSLSNAIEYMTSLKDLRFDDNVFVVIRGFVRLNWTSIHDICIVY